MAKEKFDRSSRTRMWGRLGTLITEDDVDGGDHEGIGEGEPEGEVPGVRFD